MDQPTLTDLEIETCARAAHEANRAYCLAHGDESQPPWSEAPAWQRESALLGVRGVAAGNGPRESHKGWTAEKLRTGWTFGPVKDPVAKTHPCLVPYDALPPEQRAKDALFIGTVKAMLGAMADAAGRGPKVLDASAGEPLPAAAPPILQHFTHAHLPPHLQAVSRPLGEIARSLAKDLPPGPELSAGLRKLLEAKDAFVRAAIEAARAGT